MLIKASLIIDSHGNEEIHLRALQKERMGAFFKVSTDISWSVFIISFT